MLQVASSLRQKMRLLLVALHPLTRTRSQSLSLRYANTTAPQQVVGHKQASTRSRADVVKRLTTLRKTK